MINSRPREGLRLAELPAETTLLLLDVDNFKSVNDRYGHPAGDDVLVQLATIVSRRCRPTDIVSRLGGDELALLLPGSPPAAARARAEIIRADVASHLFIVAEGQYLSVSASIGLAHAPTDARDLRSLYAAADAALYQAKRAGRNRVAATSPAVASARVAVPQP